ncbi:MAG: hypothetical protein ACI4F4_09575 [Lachnospiraceae bacterium]
MGKLYLRKTAKAEGCWTDTTAPKHKHNYSIESNVELSQPDGIYYFHVMKCAYCSSFRCIPTEASMHGYIPKPIEGLPTVKLYRTHKSIGLKGARLHDL